LRGLGCERFSFSSKDGKEALRKSQRGEEILAHFVLIFLKKKIIEKKILREKEKFEIQEN